MMLSQRLKRAANGYALLYVEDEGPLREQVGKFLEKFFGRVETAENGREGLELLGKKTFDLVVSDIRMPSMDGLAMTEAIRKRDGKIPIIITSAFDDKEFLHRAIELGITHYVLKPIEYPPFMLVLLKTVRLLELERRVEMLHGRVRKIINFQENLLLLAEAGKVVSANRALLRFFGLHGGKEAGDLEKAMGERFLREEGFFAPREPDRWIGELAETGIDACRVKVSADGEERILFLKTTSLPGEREERILSLTDITLLESKSLELRRESMTDPLTRLPDRLRFMEELERSILRVRGAGEPLALFFLDLDHFREVNDRLGAPAGDALLLRLVRLVEKGLKTRDFLARWQGDALVLLSPGTGNEEGKERGEALRRQVEEADLGATVTCSVGVALLAPGDSGESFVDRAETLLDRAKEEGRNRVASFLGEWEKEAERKREGRGIGRILELIREEGGTLRLFNRFRELPVTQEGRILAVGLRETRIKTTINQLLCMEREGEVFLVHDLLPRPVLAGVEALDPLHLNATLGRFRYAATSPLERQYVRVAPAGEIPILLETDRERMEGKLTDLSLRAFSFRVPGNPPVKSGDFGRLACTLPLPGNGPAALSLRCRIFLREPAAEGTRMVATLISDGRSEALLSRYISGRQAEIVRELQRQV